MAESEAKGAIESQYLLRSQFYLRRALDFARACHPRHVPAAERSRLDWGERDRFGISSEAWDRVKAARLDPALIFCHPALVAQSPDCLDYYARNACLSKKGVARLCSAADGGKREPSRSRAPAILNRHISALIESEKRFLARATLFRLRIMSYGAEVNGSWRNQVGRTGAEVVQRLLLEWLAQHKAVKSLLGYRGQKLRSVQGWRVLPRAAALPNGYRIQFGSEPDIAIRDAQGVL